MPKTRIGQKEYLECFKKFRDSNYIDGQWQATGKDFVVEVNKAITMYHGGLKAKELEALCFVVAAEGASSYESLKSKHNQLRSKIRKDLKAANHRAHGVPGGSDPADKLHGPQLADCVAADDQIDITVKQKMPGLPPFDGTGRAASLSGQELLDLL